MQWLLLERWKINICFRSGLDTIAFSFLAWFQIFLAFFIRLFGFRILKFGILAAVNSVERKRTEASRMWEEDKCADKSDGIRRKENKSKIEDNYLPIVNRAIYNVRTVCLELLLFEFTDSGRTFFSPSWRFGCFESFAWAPKIREWRERKALDYKLSYSQVQKESSPV